MPSKVAFPLNHTTLVLAFLFGTMPNCVHILFTIAALHVYEDIRHLEYPYKILLRVFPLQTHTAN